MRSPGGSGFTSTPSASGGGDPRRVAECPSYECCSGRPLTEKDNKMAEVVEQTLNTIPEDGTHRSVRSMAERTGVSHTTMHRMWSVTGLDPHRSRTFKQSTDPLFVGRV